MTGRGTVHVLVGLIGDAHGRWLVNRRRSGTHMAGFWEFPGGKRAAGEERYDALRRELQEELGIEVLAAEPFSELVHDYPDNRVRLDVWRIVRYRGEPQSRAFLRCLKQGAAAQWRGARNAWSWEPRAQ